MSHAYNQRIASGKNRGRGGRQASAIVDLVDVLKGIRKKNGLRSLLVLSLSLNPSSKNRRRDHKGPTLWQLNRSYSGVEQ